MPTPSKKRFRSPGLVVGVTGGIGSGKSEVCRLLKKRGRTVFAADQIGISLAENHRLVRSRIRRLFGGDVFTAGGRLDRAKLASIVFRDPKQLDRLNAIIHPAVLRQIQRSLASLRPKQKLPYVVVESALIYEAGLEALFDFVILVDAPLSTRVERAARSSGKARAEIKRRARHQLSGRISRSRADFVVVNEGTKRGLRESIRFIDKTLESMAKSMAT